MRKTAVCLASVLVAGTLAVAQKPPARFITETFPPSEEIRKPALTVEAFPKGPTAVLAYDGSGRYLATAGADNVVKLWEARTGEQGTGELLKSIRAGRDRPVLPGWDSVRAGRPEGGRHA